MTALDRFLVLAGIAAFALDWAATGALLAYAVHARRRMRRQGDLPSRQTVELHAVRDELRAHADEVHRLMADNDDLRDENRRLLALTVDAGGPR